MAKKRLKIKDRQGNVVDYDISAASVTIDIEGKSLEVKLTEIAAALLEQVKRVTFNGATHTVEDGSINIGNQIRANWDETDTEYPSYIRNKPNVPTRTSQLTNDSGYITAEQVPTGSTVDTQMSSTSENPVQNKVIKAYVDSLINGLINGAPAALDTLNELAAALGNDANFAATITNILASKANDNAVVKSISVNGTTQTPDNGNVNIVVPSGGSDIDPATAAPIEDGTAAVGVSDKYAREDHVHPHDTSKQDTISDLAAIRSGAALGATALQPTGMDNAPTANSNNPVKSGGIKQYVDEAVANAEVTVIPQGSFGVLDSLASTSASDALSANKGRELDQTKVNKSDIAMEESVTYDGSVGTIDNTYIMYSNGTVDNTNGKKASDYIDIAKFAGGTMTLSVSYSSSLAGLAFYNSSKSFISGVQYSKQNKASVSIPSNAAYVRFSTNGQSSLTAALTAYTIDAFKAFIEGLGDKVSESAIGRTKTMTYTEDDCTISGYILTTGASQTSTNFKRSDYIPLAGTSYTFSLAWEANASNAAAGVAFYNSSKQFIGYRNSAGTDIAYPTGAAYAIIMSRLNAATSLSFSLNGVEGFNATFDDMLSKVNQIDLSVPKRHILFVGNSFAANACSMLGTLGTNLGVSNINVQYIEYSGSTLAQWVTDIKNNNTRTLVTAVNGGNLFTSGTMSAILSQPWDIIVFQQASASSDDYSTYTPYLSQLVNYVKSLCSNPDVKVAFQMTWQTYQSNYSDIITAAKSMADDYLGFGVDLLIPNGTAIQNIRGTSVNTDANDLSEDTNIQHLAAGVAKYVAACCVYTSLIERYTGMSVYGDTTTTTNSSGTGVVNVSASNRQICQRAAVYACIRPFATTPASVLE